MTRFTDVTLNASPFKVLNF